LTKGEFIQFVGQARGSLLELFMQLEIALQLDFECRGFRHVDSQAASVSRLLNGLVTSLRSQSKAASPE
jgi:four helix bundle protein